MARTIRRSTAYSAPPERVLAVFLDPETLRARHRAQGAIESTVKETHRDDKRLVQVVECKEYAHNKTGGRDRSRTELTKSVYEWDLGTRRCTWRYEGPDSGRIQVGGSFHVLASGSGSELKVEVDIKVGIPLLGRVIEALIASDIEKFLDSYSPSVPAEGG